MPITVEQHKYVTQDSSLNHISLQNFPPHTHPWGLQNRHNFEEFQRCYWGTVRLDYDLFISMLNDPLAPAYYLQNLQSRLRLVA